MLMAHPKREVALTPQEKMERNRRYQQTRRDKTNNNYARAYRRASQRAVAWFQTRKKDVWEEWLQEELAQENTKPYAPAMNCKHDGDKFVMGVGVGCEICGKAVGVKAVSEDDRADLADHFPDLLES